MRVRLITEWLENCVIIDIHKPVTERVNLPVTFGFLRGLSEMDDAIKDIVLVGETYYYVYVSNFTNPQMTSFVLKSHGWWKERDATRNEIRWVYQIPPNGKA